MEKSTEFILDDKLTWVQEAVIAICSYSLGGPAKEGKGSKVKQKACQCFCYFTYDGLKHLD